jgi:hypothetical protein
MPGEFGSSRNLTGLALRQVAISVDHITNILKKHQAVFLVRNITLRNWLALVRQADGESGQLYNVMFFLC